MSQVTAKSLVLEKTAGIPVPENVFVACPAKSFKQVLIKHCPTCPHFAGLIDTVPNPSQPVNFADRYRVFCGHAIARRLTELEID